MNVEISVIYVRYFSLKQIALQSLPDIEQNMAEKSLREKKSNEVLAFG